MSGHTHTIPVDASQTTEEAWKEICIFGRRVTFTGSETWANVECNCEECSGIEARTQSPRACITCGHDPACGLASIHMNGVERWYCHDDDHSCYAFSPEPKALDDALATLCQHRGESGAVCGLPIMEVASHSSYDCEIEGTTWVHDAEMVPEPLDPCVAYDADDDHEALASASSTGSDVAHSEQPGTADGDPMTPAERYRAALEKIAEWGETEPDDNHGAEWWAACEIVGRIARAALNGEV